MGATTRSQTVADRRWRGLAARTLNRALALTRALATRTLSRVLNRALSRALNRALNRAMTLNRAQSARTPTLTRTLARALAAVALTAIVVTTAGCGLLDAPTPAPPGPGESAAAEGDEPAGAALVPAQQPDPDIPAAETTPVLKGTIQTRKPGKPVAKVIGQKGGIVTAGALTLDFPDGALAAKTKVSVTQATITGLGGDAYGGAIQPASPLYTVAVGGAPEGAPEGAPADDPAEAVEVTVRYQRPPGAADGATAMAFYVEPETGILSPLAPLGDDGSTVTALAPHFSSIVIGLVDWARIPETVDSGFRPGVDDWGFDNYGSYPAPGGQCEGQTLSEIWYYETERKAGGASALHGLYDNNGRPERTPDFWMDDADAYRYVADVHTSPIMDLATYLRTRNQGWAAPNGLLTYNAMRAAIAFSGRPQMLRISPDGVVGGHTMVAYRVSPAGILVADPNYTGKLRVVTWTAALSLLGPYSSGDSATSIAGKGETSYTHFAYVPWLSARTQLQMNLAWRDFEQGVAGDAVFDTYDLLVVADQPDDAGNPVTVPLVDGHTTTVSTASISVDFTGNPTGGALIAAYRGTRRVAFWSNQVDIRLDPGANEIGIAVYGSHAGEPDTSYMDFVRLTINLVDAATDEPAASAGAGWVRTAATADEPFPTPFKGDGESLSLQAADGSYTETRVVEANGVRNTGTITWASPPASAAAGEAWAATISAKASCADAAYQYAIGGSLSAYIAGGGASVPEPAGTPSAKATCGASSASSAFTFTFPPDPGAAGTELVIAVGWSGNSDGGFTYRYTWQP